MQFDLAGYYGKVNRIIMPLVNQEKSASRTPTGMSDKGPGKRGLTADKKIALIPLAAVLFVLLFAWLFPPVAGSRQDAVGSKTSEGRPTPRRSSPGFYGKK